MTEQIPPRPDGAPPVAQTPTPPVPPIPPPSRPPCPASYLPPAPQNPYAAPAEQAPNYPVQPYSPPSPYGQPPYAQDPYAAPGQMVPAHPQAQAPALYGQHAPYGYAPVPQQPQSNGIAVGGFVVGLISIFLPFLLGLAAGVAGIIMSANGIGRAKRIGTGKGLAVAGLVLSIIGTVLIL